MDSQSLDRVLSTRLDSVDIVLEEIHDLTADVAKARSGLDALSKQVGALSVLGTKAQTGLNALRAALENISTTTRNAPLDEDFDPTDTADELDSQVEQAAALTRQLKDLVERSTSAVKTVERLRRWAALPDERRIDTELTASARKLTERLKHTRTGETPWQLYAQDVQNACDELFAQYVDLVSGIALRDHGLDRQVSRFADKLVPELLSLWGGADYAMAVPSRHTSQALIQAQHVRLPLPPGWSLWSLPLVARGVGELFRLRHEPEKLLLPDVFGTYVLGPAYAFAAILLELDPGGADDGRDAQRANAILKVLEYLDAGDDNHRFTELATELRAQWTAATNAARTGPGSDEVANDAIQDLCDVVATRCDNAAYTAHERWDKVEAIRKQLVAADYKPDPDANLKDVLNAMWIARWLKPGETRTIFENATNLAELVVETRGGGREKVHQPLSPSVVPR